MILLSGIIEKKQLGGQIHAQRLDGAVNVVPNSGDVSGSVEITENGEHDVAKYAKANVSVPIPDGYVQPEGTLRIVRNGEVDIAKYSKANVSVPIPEGYLKPEGVKGINKNGIYTVAQYAMVHVEVEDTGGEGGGGESQIEGFIVSPLTASFALQSDLGAISLNIGALAYTVTAPAVVIQEG